mgnify:FL=1
MKQFVIKTCLLKNIKAVLAVLLILCLAISCNTLDPKKVDVELPETEPTQKITQYYNALDDLGLMTEIYDINELKIQSMNIDDKTGANVTTGREIPKEITEIVKSTLNSIGGRVTYIPYDPTFIREQATTGYGAGIKEFTIPEVILSGGITEFDRGLETRGSNTDFSGKKNFSAITPVPEMMGKNTGSQYGNSAKSGLARITLDFNLLNFSKMIGIPKMNTTNSMEVGKSLKGKELAISVFGLSFGRKGTIKKVQGRHEAVRLLVEYSMIQIVGKHKALPYWRLLGDDAIEDKIVIRKIEKFYHSLDGYEQIQSAQEYLFLHGYDLVANGQMDSTTISALQQYDSNFNIETNEIDLKMFKDLYLTIPINVETLARREMINNYYAQLQQYEQEQLTVQQQPEPQYQQQQEALVESSNETGQSYQEESQSQQNVQEVTPLVEEAHVPSASGKKSSIGRVLTDEEW